MTKGIFVAVPLALALGFVGSAHAAGSADCFNPKLYKKGTKVEMLYVLKSPKGKGTIKFNSTVGGKKNFNGKKATEVKSSSITKFNGKTSKINSKTYVSANNVKKIEYFHGNVVTTPSPAKTVVTAKISRPQQDRFKLRKNQSYSQRTKWKIKTDTVISTPQGDFKSSTNSTILSKRTKKFLGMSTVTVPAGKFQACRYKITDADTTNGNTSKSSYISYVSTKYGLEVLTKAGKTVTKLKSAKINGQAVK